MSFMDCLPDTGGCIVGGTLVTFVLGLVLLFLIECLFPALVLGFIVKCVIVLFGGFALIILIALLALVLTSTLFN